MKDAPPPRAWICQVDRRTGLVRARSVDEPSFTVACSGMGDAMAKPYFLLEGFPGCPEGMSEARLLEVLGEAAP